MWPDQENFIRSHLRLGDEIHLAAAELSLAEKINVRQEETQAYAFTAFLADAGGALGLFLGLSVLQILHWLCSLYYYLLKTFNCFNHSVRQVTLDNLNTRSDLNFRGGRMSLGHQVVDHFRVDFQARYRNKTQLEHLLKIQKILFRYLLIPLLSNHRLLTFERLFNKFKFLME